jgi:WhiB family transcriptional regulator, redox-sensing transcriptional regulator
MTGNRDQGLSAAELARTAQRLSRLHSTSSRALANAVTDNGACMTVTAADNPPRGLFNAETDRQLAARLCEGCPVQYQCLELELRLSGAQTVGVWGALNEDDRRALFPYWQPARNSGPSTTTNGGEHR